METFQKVAMVLKLFRNLLQIEEIIKTEMGKDITNLLLS